MRTPAPPVPREGESLLPGIPNPAAERSPTGTLARSTDELRKAAMRDPLVREVMARFDARLVDVTVAQPEPAIAAEPKTAPLEPGMTVEADVLPVMEPEELRELD